MADQRKIKIGLIGAGKMGGFHAQKLAEISSVSFLGLYDVDQTRAKAIIDQINLRPEPEVPVVEEVAPPTPAAPEQGTPSETAVPVIPKIHRSRRKAFETLDELLEKCEAVVIAAATKTHFELAKTCLERGKHVFVEKPLAETSEEALKLVELASNQQKLIAVGHIERFNPAYIALKKHIHKHMVLRVDAIRESRFPERMSDYDVVFDMMIHDIDLVIDLAKTIPESVEATGQKIKTDKFDKAEAKLLMQNGILATLKGSRVEENVKRELTVTLDEFNLVADLQNKKLYKKDLAKPEDPDPYQKVHELKVAPGDQITLELKDFVSAIRNNRQPKVTGEHGLDAIRIAEAIEKGGYQA